jgi:hypothetical protein
MVDTVRFLPKGDSMHKQRKKSDVKVIRVRPEKLAEVMGGRVNSAVDCAVDCGAVDCAVDCGAVDCGAIDCGTAVKRSL